MGRKMNNNDTGEVLSIRQRHRRLCVRTRVVCRHCDGMLKTRTEQSTATCGNIRRRKDEGTKSFRVP